MRYYDSKFACDCYYIKERINKEKTVPVKPSTFQTGQWSGMCKINKYHNKNITTN